MLLEKTKIYGVDGVGQLSTSLARTDNAAGLIFTIGESEIQSDFSSCYPWCDMEEVCDEYGNMFIRIPKFYSRITKNQNGTYKLQISGCRYDGFATLFVDGKGNEIDFVLVGKYEGSGSPSRIYSKSGQTVLVHANISEFRDGCRANGEGYQQYDFLIDAIIKQLFMVEFATTNCQSIMAGWTKGTAALVTGHTDGIKTASGSGNAAHTKDCAVCNTDGLHACKYRGIENPWGNVDCFCDGISFNKEKIYVCKDPTMYRSGVFDGAYVYHADRAMTSGYVRQVSPFEKNPLLGFVSVAGGSENSYYSDNYTASDGGTILFVGGSWENNTAAGLWLWNGSVAASFSSESKGGRLCYKPI